MANIRHLERAPITEALIDFRVILEKGFDAENFSPLISTLKDRYPINEQMRRKLMAQFGMGESGPFVKTDAKIEGLKADELLGFTFKTDDSTSIAQFRSDGFTYNLLKPYTNWEAMRDEAQSLWELYNQYAPVNRVIRIALRFINHVNLPLPIDDLKEYFVAPPTVPEDIPHSIAGFFCKVTTLDASNDIAAHITHAMEKGVEPNHVNIVLDIDTFKTKDYKPTAKKMWNDFELLRNSKNNIFFNSITEKTARLFE